MPTTTTEFFILNFRVQTDKHLCESIEQAELTGACFRQVLSEKEGTTRVLFSREVPTA